MKKEHALRLAALSSAFGLGVALMAWAPAVLAQPAQTSPVPASAQQAPAAVPQPVQDSARNAAEDPAAMADAEEPEYHERLQVGDATQGLLAWQRSGELASPTPRPIAGDVANRSYERYLKSFEFPIPERMTSSVKSSSGSGSGASTAR